MTYQPPEEESGTWDEELAENLPTTRYAYDGQMCALEDFTRYLGGSTMSVDKKRYALGARGIEMIESRAVNPSTLEYDPWQTAFPLYDGHGNVIATLSRGTGGAYQVSNLRSFDTWGGVRSGNTQGAPSQRYCASLGHVQDDESSLIYMRARYYEPWTGRFISEDPAMDGANWFSYCGNEPVGMSDLSGRSAVEQAFLMGALSAFFGAISYWISEGLVSGRFSTGDYGGSAATIGAATGFFANGFANVLFMESYKGLTTSQFIRRLVLESVKSVVAGSLAGALVASYYGMNAGAILAELFYVEHCND